MPDPTNEEYLCVVSEWSSYGHAGGRVGNAYPILSLTRSDAVTRPQDEFPNPGAIFLTARGDLNVWDYILVRPTNNLKYSNASPRDCFFIPRRAPTPLDVPPSDCRFAVLLDVPFFDPVETSGLIRNATQGVTPLFFVRDLNQKIFGPLTRVRTIRTEYDTLSAIQWAPYGEDSVIYEFTAETLWSKDLKIVKYEHPDGNLNEVLKEPINMIVGPVLTATSSKAYDRVPEIQLADWYGRWQNLEEYAEPVHKFFKSVSEHLSDTTPEIIRQRCKRIANLISRLDALEGERRYIAQRFLQSPEGKQVVDHALNQEIERRATFMDEEVKRRRVELSIEERELAKRLGDLRDTYQTQKLSLDEELNVLEQKKGEIEGAVEDLESRLDKGLDKLKTKLKDTAPLLAAFMGRGGTMRIEGSSGPSVDNGSSVRRSSWTDITFPTPTRELDDSQEEAALVERLVDALAADQLGFTREFVTNIWICLKASSLNLIMGPPGHGKSSIVGSLARALGHGQSLLEIAVRRSWSDDRHLLGFFDTFHGRYDPGPTGLATRLLQAQRDWEQMKRGMYMVLLDEFNLAAPEYYFSQLLQILARPIDQRVVQLYDSGMLPNGSSEAVNKLQVNPNVSFWGTINYDETTERLSPRLLDRTGMIFLTARDVTLGVNSMDLLRGRRSKGVSAGRICESWMSAPEQCPEECWDQIVPLLDHLKQQTEEWGGGIDISPRVIDAVKRYLSNSRNLLTPVRAVDFAFQQRVLPVLRGRGQGYAARMKVLQQKLQDSGFERSARHVHDALSLSEANFGDIDFLAYS